MIRVCIITTVHPPFDVRIFHKEAKSLIKAGYDVTIIAQHDKKEIVKSVKIVNLPHPRNRIERRLKTIWTAFQKALMIKADIYHFHDPELIPIGLLLKIFTKSRVVYDVHEDVPEQIFSWNYIPKKLRHPVSIIFNYFEKNLSRVFDYVICSTETIMSKFKLYNNNSITIKNYIPKRYIESFRDKNYHSEDKSIIIFSGGIYEERGIMEAIKALNLLPDLCISFVLCGSVEQSYLNLIIKEDKYNRVIYKGILTFEDALQETFKADIGYICDYPLKRHMEGLPVKLFEYMALGIPVIASDFPIWKKIIDQAKCGFTVNPMDIEEIANKVCYLIEHVNERKQMGENGRRAIINNYTWETEADKLLSIYKSMEGVIS